MCRSESARSAPASISLAGTTSVRREEFVPAARSAPSHSHAATRHDARTARRVPDEEARRLSKEALSPTLEVRALHQTSRIAGSNVCNGSFGLGDPPLSVRAFLAFSASCQSAFGQTASTRTLILVEAEFSAVEEKQCGIFDLRSGTGSSPRLECGAQARSKEATEAEAGLGDPFLVGAGVEAQGSRPF